MHLRREFSKLDRSTIHQSVVDLHVLVWLHLQHNSLETKRWCEEHGVKQIFCLFSFFMSTGKMRLRLVRVIH